MGLVQLGSTKVASNVAGTASPARVRAGLASAVEAAAARSRELG